MESDITIPTIFWTIVSIIFFIYLYKEYKKSKLEKENVLEQNKTIKFQKIPLEALPIEVTSQLLEGEDVFYFSYIDINSGCGCLGGNSSAKYWISLTDKRVLYKSKIKEDDNCIYVEKNGIIPLKKISSIEVTYGKQGGCVPTEYYELKIGNPGGAISIPIPTEYKGLAVRKCYMELLEYQKEEKQEGENE